MVLLDDKVTTILNIIWYGEQIAVPARGTDIMQRTQYRPMEVAYILNMLLAKRYIIDSWEMENGKGLNCFRIDGDNAAQVYNILHGSQFMN